MKTEAEIKKIFADEIERLRKEARPKTGGLILPPEPGCIHDWQRHFLRLCYESNGRNGVWVSRCSKCHVLGVPPE
jgi:hypothetical protein